jgi:hypothetical protein
MERSALMDWAELALKGLKHAVNAVVTWVEAINSGADLEVKKKAHAEIAKMQATLSGLSKLEADEQAELDLAVPPSD